MAEPGDIYADVLRMLFGNGTIGGTTQGGGAGGVQAKQTPRNTWGGAENFYGMNERMRQNQTYLPQVNSSTPPEPPGPENGEYDYALWKAIMGTEAPITLTPEDASPRTGAPVEANYLPQVRNNSNQTTYLPQVNRYLEPPSPANGEYNYNSWKEIYDTEAPIGLTTANASPRTGAPGASSTYLPQVSVGGVKGDTSPTSKDRLRSRREVINTKLRPRGTEATALAGGRGLMEGASGKMEAASAGGAAASAAAGGASSGSGGGAATGAGGGSGGGSGGGAVSPITGWTDQERRDITVATVGREMSEEELNQWLYAFDQEHGGMPWQIGPFDAHNNFLDHLFALGQSEREVAQGMASPYTKQGSEGNSMADAAITPDFWEDSYYSRYRGPTFMPGRGGTMINMGSQYLQPGQLPGRTWPAQLAANGEIDPRLYYQYMRAMDPSQWEPPGSAASGSGNVAPHYSTNTGYW